MPLFAKDKIKQLEEERQRVKKDLEVANLQNLVDSEDEVRQIEGEMHRVKKERKFFLKQLMIHLKH